ncbi:MAG: ferredoxin [Brevinematales bacterium]|nr:ferredoxin [Brevinematales bacterium]
MPIEIYYFTGSGNSLFAARELQKRLPGSVLIPIARLLRQDKIESAGDKVGIVFPLHGMTLPVPVEIFLRKLFPQPGSYIFGVTTRGGTKFYGFKKMEKLLRKKKSSLSASFLINMADNDPKLKHWKPLPIEEMQVIENKSLARLEFIAEKVKHSEKYHEPDLEGVSISKNPVLNFLFDRLILFAMWMMKLIGVGNYFYADEACNGCGICEKVCPSGKIAMTNKKPGWLKNIRCYFCYACINFCPKSAVQIHSKWYMKSYTPQNGRYSHPYAKIADMTAQK